MAGWTAQRLTPEEHFAPHAYHVLIDNDEYGFAIEEHRRPSDGQQLLIAHLRFKQFTPSVMKHCLRDWRLFRQCVQAPLFAWGEEQDDKWVRFVTRLGFSPLDSWIVCKNGERRQLYLNAPGYGLHNANLDPERDHQQLPVVRSAALPDAGLQRSPGGP